MHACMIVARPEQTSPWHAESDVRMYTRASVLVVCV